MSIVADLTVPADQFALGDALVAAPDVRVEFERLVTHSQEWIMPFLWVTGADTGAFDDAVRLDPTVADVSVADQFDGVTLYRVEWADDVRELVNTIFDRSGTLVHAVAEGPVWELQVRFDDHASLSTVQAHFADAAVGFEVNRLFTPSEPRHTVADTTSAQREALLAALAAGYFDVPRRTTIDELAADLGVSSNAVSERLRRGTSNLLESTLANGPDNAASDDQAAPGEPTGDPEPSPQGTD